MRYNDLYYHSFHCTTVSVNKNAQVELKARIIGFIFIFCHHLSDSWLFKYHSNSTVSKFTRRDLQVRLQYPGTYSMTQHPWSMNQLTSKVIFLYNFPQTNSCLQTHAPVALNILCVWPQLYHGFITLVV